MTPTGWGDTFGDRVGPPRPPPRGLGRSGLRSVRTLSGRLVGGPARATTCITMRWPMQRKRSHTSEAQSPSTVAQHPEHVQRQPQQIG